MGTSKPRSGSLQFYPRKRAAKFLPRVNWGAVSSDKPGFLGFIGYKAGMKSAYVRDNTEHSLTKGKRIVVPVTIIECPEMKIFSVRFYKDSKVMKEVINSGLDKELRKKLKLPKEVKTKEEIEKIEKEGGFDDVKVIVYSQVKKTGIKKKPDLAEIGLGGSLDEKMKIIKENLAKEISVADIFGKELADVRGLTTGRGTVGAVKRFGITLKSHKSEKGRRRPGSLGPWHPARVVFRVPMAGQLGLFSRICYNNLIISKGRASEKDINPKSGFKNYGKIKTDYLIVKGSVQGAVKRQVLITKALRKTKGQKKLNYELVELR